MNFYNFNNYYKSKVMTPRREFNGVARFNGLMIEYKSILPTRPISAIKRKIDVRPLSYERKVLWGLIKPKNLRTRREKPHFNEVDIKCFHFWKNVRINNRHRQRGDNAIFTDKHYYPSRGQKLRMQEAFVKQQKFEPQKGSGGSGKPAIPTSVKQRKFKTSIFETEKSVLNNRYKVKEEKPPITDFRSEELKFLKFKLRLKILSFRSPHIVERLYLKALETFESEGIVGQMDEGSIVQETLNVTDIKSNVNIVSSDPPEKGVSHFSSDGFAELAVSRERQIFSTMTDRWIRLKSFEWKTGKDFNEVITYTPTRAEDTATYKIDMPDMLFRQFKDTPNMQILMNHRFFRADLKFRFVLNSSPWQTGMAIACWTYGSWAPNTKLNTVLSAVQRNHACLQAGSSNDVELTVPYHYWSSYMDNSNYHALTMGYISIYNLIPLQATQNVASKATITVFVSLENVDVHGLISRTIVENDTTPPTLKSDHDFVIVGQMDTITSLCNAVDLGTNVLRTVNGAFNRDNPPKPLQPLSFVPQSMPSFAYTDKVAEPINVLRADPQGQRITPCISNEMDLKRLMRTWGLYSLFNWSFASTVGSELWSTPVEPFSKIDNYNFALNTQNAGVKQNWYPPIAMAASMAGKYRGNIEYKFVVVANSFYTGSIAISAVPKGRSDFTFEDGSRSYTEIIDIRKSNEFIISVPWNWNNAWATTKSMYQESDAYSWLKVFVVNPLIAVSTVPSNLNVVVYIRAGENFELAQMRPPLLALTGTYILPMGTEYLKPYDLETSIWSSWSHRAVDKNGKYFLTMAESTNNDGFVGFTNVRLGWIYKLDSYLLDRTTQFRFGVYTTKNKVQSLSYEYVYGVGVPGYETSNAQGIVILPSLALAISLRDLILSGDYSSFLTAHPECQYEKEGPYSEIKTKGSKTWVQAPNLPNNHPVWFVIKERPPRGQMDTKGYVVEVERLAPKTNMGLRVYGESMPDIKGMARRWQHLGSVTASTCNNKYPRDCKYFCKFPVKPSRSLNIDSSGSYDNRVRDGNIGVFSSGFYLWDGSMRYRIIPVKALPDDSVIYVQHRFDDSDTKLEIVTESDDQYKLNAFMDPQYATYAQATDVNPIVTIEVPYYNENERLLCTGEFGSPRSNGFLYVWIHTVKAVDVQLELYYSVGDDFQWSVFQGFPAMIDLTQIASEPKPRGQMNEASVVIEPQGLMSKVAFKAAGVQEKTVEKTTKQVGEAAEVLTKELPKALSTFERLSAKLESFVNSIERIPKLVKGDENSEKSWLQSIMESSFDYLSHIIYAIIHPSPITIGWCMVNLYKKIWGLSPKGIQVMMECVSNLWRKATEPTKQTQVQGQMDDTDLSSLCSLLYCSFSSLLSVSTSPPKNWKDVSAGLFKFSHMAKGSSYVGTFIKDNLTLIRRIWNKFISYFGIGSPNYKFIAGIEDVRLREWCAQSTAILNPGVHQTVMTNTLWADRVFELSLAGRAIIAILSTEKKTPPAMLKLVSDNLNQLKKLEQDLVNQNIYAAERYEPFCLWVWGGAGCGKTRFLNEVAVELADMMNIPCASTYHTLTIQQQYFDGYKGQPSILIDDFLAVDPLADALTSMFVQMKSSCMFNPPYSDIKDKTKLINFHNLLISSNFSSIKNRPGIHDEDAYNRRRDLLLRAEARPLPKGKKEWTQEDYNKMEHVLFYHNANVLNPDNTGVLIRQEQGKTYRESVMKFVLDYARRYHDKESKSYTDRCKRKIERLSALSDVENIDDYFSRITPIFAEQVNKSGHAEAKGKWDITTFAKYWRSVQSKGYIPTMKGEDEDNPSPSTSGYTKLPSNSPFAEKEPCRPVKGQAPEEECLPPLNIDLTFAERWARMEKLSNAYASFLKAPEKPIGDYLSKDKNGEFHLYYYTGNTNILPSVTPAGFWPYCKFTDQMEAKHVTVQRTHGTNVIEPVPRTAHSTYSPNTCLHKLMGDPEDYVYNEVEKCFTFVSSTKHNVMDVPQSIPVGACHYLNDDGVVEVMLHCDMLRNEVARQFRMSMLNVYLQNPNDIASDFPKLDVTDILLVNDFPRHYIAEACHKLKQNADVMDEVFLKRGRESIERLQDKLNKDIEIIDGVVLQKKPTWKRYCSKAWAAFLTTCRWTYKVFTTFQSILATVGMLCSVGFLGTLGYTIYKSGMPMDQALLGIRPEPNLHPSGDYKTIKSRGTLQSKALSLLDPDGHNENSGQIIVDDDDAIISKQCSISSSVDQSSAILKNISNNVFTLVGIKKLEGTKCELFRVRCIGLKMYTFLVLKHYIEHFEGKGVTEVAIVYNKNQGMVRFDLKDIKFKFTGESGGYGIGEFPTLARPFKNILKYIPTEKFDGSYPAEMYMVEVNNADLNIQKIVAKRIKTPIYVPRNGVQSPWTIEQGFSYQWGGPGRCCSFVFAPNLACPLVAVHTAGIGTEKGYAELLLRETFEERDDISLDFVVPQMNHNPASLDLPGEGYVVGHLPPNKAVQLPTKTKIINSEIAGVFPITTEPAPLSKDDERLPYGCDPLIEGIKKRCDKPKELPKALLQKAYIDVVETLYTQVTPLRDPEPLTLCEAVEGFELEGYDTLELKTSEGYPWILDRPKGFSDKSWMFKTSSKENGKLKVDGVYGPLKDLLSVKEDMRKRGIVPATYYTACLKDARILKEKVSTPGKTRVFEMSPVDLTISQRQYFLDFYASYTKSRMNAENTIGINPDGYEWNMLANSLLEFSPYILTADYSGYGPRLLMSVQFKAYQAQIAWFRQQEQKFEHHEDKIHENFLIRYTMLWEMLHPLTVVKNAVVYFPTGMPSGNAGTVIQNSLCNSLMIRVMYLFLAERNAPQYADMCSFNNFVLMFSNGDDLIISVKEEIITWFNNRTLIEGFAEFNIKMTDALKSGVIREYCSLEEATYLKRGFLKHPTREGCWLAPLEEASITDTANWVWKSTDIRAASLVNSEMSCRLAYTRGPKYYNKVVRKIKQAWLQLGVKFEAPEWDSLDRHVWDGTPGPVFRF